MKIFTKYQLFKEAMEITDSDPDPVVAAKDRLNSYEDNIEEFNKEKGKLENLVMNAKPGEDIDDKVKDIIGEGDDVNDLLSRLLEVLLLTRQVAQGEARLGYFTRLKGERQGDIQATNQLSDEEEKQQQIESLTKQIEDIDAKYKSMQDNIKQWKKEMDEKRKELDEYVNDTTEDIEDNVKDMDKNFNTIK